MEELFLTFALISLQLIVFATIAMVFIMFYRVEILYINYKKLSRGTSNQSMKISYCNSLINWLQLKEKQLLWYLIMFGITYAGMINLYNYRPSLQFYMTDYYWNFYTIMFLYYARYIELVIMLIISIWMVGRLWFVKKRILIQ